MFEFALLQTAKSKLTSERIKKMFRHIPGHIFFGFTALENTRIPGVSLIAEGKGQHKKLKGEEGGLAGGDVSIKGKGSAGFKDVDWNSFFLESG